MSAFILFCIQSATAQPAVDWSRAQSVTVTMVDNRFLPDKLTFRRNVPYHLHLENHGKELHEFTAPEFFASAMMPDSHVLANQGKDIAVQPGGAADVFLLPRQSGSFRLICADHDWDGMVGEITVE